MSTPTKETPETRVCTNCGRSPFDCQCPRPELSKSPKSLRAMADDAEVMAAHCRTSVARDIATREAAEFRARADELESAGKGEAGPYRIGDAPLMCQRAIDDPRDQHWPVFDGSQGCVAHVFGLGDAKLFASALNARAIEAAESNLLADTLAALRCLLAGYANAAGAHAEYGDFEEWAAVKDARHVLARAPGGRSK